MLGMPECLRDGADDRETKRFPQPNGRGIGLHDGVELHSQVAVRGGNFHCPVSQGAPYPSACRGWRHHETCVSDVTASGRVIGMNLGSPDNHIVINGDKNSTAELAHPPGPRRLLTGICGPAVCLSRGNDWLQETPDIRPVGIDGVSYLHP